MTDKELKKKLEFAEIDPRFVLAVELWELGYTESTVRDQLDSKGPTALAIRNYLRDFERNLIMNKRFDVLKVNVLGRRGYSNSAYCYYFGGNKKTNWLKRFIREKQEYLERRCVSIWDFENRNDEKYIFGKFKDDETDDTIIITVAYYCKGIGWLPSRG